MPKSLSAAALLDYEQMLTMLKEAASRDIAVAVRYGQAIAQVEASQGAARADHRHQPGLIGGSAASGLTGSRVERGLFRTTWSIWAAERSVRAGGGYFEG